MVRDEDAKQSPPPNPKNPSPRESKKQENSMFSPRFRSVAEMAGWDEEALLIASLVVEDTPDRDAKQKKRSDLQLKTPPTNSRRKRRAQRKSPIVVPMPVLDLEEDETSKEEGEKKKIESKEETNPAEKAIPSQKDEVSCSSSSVPCLDRLREELSCAICLEICYEPSTTSCGHSFCKKCLRSAAEKCGKRCPKCRQLISSGRSCTVNTVLWNTIQLLFPQEVEARKVAAEARNNARECDNQNLPRASHYNARNGSVLSLNSPESVGRERVRRPYNLDGRNRSARPSGTSTRGELGVGRRRRVPNQDEDAALALRLQREEFMDAFRGSDAQSTNSLPFARENLRAMASRAVTLRARGRQS